MNIILGDDAAQELGNKYPILELDTIKFPDGKLITAYCVVDKPGIPDFMNLDNLKSMHSRLIQNYRLRRWDYCLDSINHLIGSWGGDVDTFYINLKNRVEEYKRSEPNESWTPVIDRQ
jgi:hypothetical protein